MINREEAVQLIDISATMAASIAQARVANGDSLQEKDLKSLFVTCVDMVNEKFENLPTAGQESNEKIATISEMNQLFSEKFADLEKKGGNFDQEKFTSISEMHRVFADKLSNVERRLASMPIPRTSRRPV